MSGAIPLETLFADATRSHPQLSPDGRRLAFIAPVDGVPNILVGDLDKTDFWPMTRETGRGLAALSEPSVRPFHWAPDGRHILFLKDEDGSENWSLHRLEVGTGQTTPLTPVSGVQAQVIGMSPRFPEHVLVALNLEDRRYHDVYRLTIATSELTRVARNPGVLCLPGMGGWLVDRHLQIRGASRLADDGGLEILVRTSGDDQFEVVLRLGLDDSMSSRALSFTEDGTGLYLLSSADSDTSRLVRFDLATRTVKEVLGADSRYDLGNEFVETIYHPETREPQLVPLVQHRRRYVVVDPALADDVAAIERLHHGDVAVVSRDGADNQWIVSFTTDDGSESYYLYDRTRRAGRQLFDGRPQLQRYPLARMEPFSYHARDGLLIEGYLAFPPGQGRHKLPTVVAPHGGPYERDVWGLNLRVQFLATRGYLVVKPNYRGSMGYGKAHLNAGDKEWGGRMQDDLVDAVQHVVNRGYADPDRVAIMGGSYGGYATLMAVAQTPQIFRCAVSLFGVANLITMRESYPAWLEGLHPQLRRRIGDPETERDLLWERSPISKVDRISTPILIGQGANDVRVTKAETDAMIAALRDHGVPHEYLVFPDEGHGFVRPENNLTFYRTAERFLARHMRL